MQDLPDAGGYVPPAAAPAGAGPGASSPSGHGHSAGGQGVRERLLSDREIEMGDEDTDGKHV